MYGNLNPLTELRQSAAALSRLTLCDSQSRWFRTVRVKALCDLIGVVPCCTDIEVEPSIVRHVLVKIGKLGMGDFIHR